MTQPHPYAEILTAIAQGKKIGRISVESTTYEVNKDTLLLAIANSEAAHPSNFVILPETITINGHEIPKPLTQIPASGVFYTPQLKCHGADLRLYAERWASSYEKRELETFLRAGYVHATKEAAIAHSRALISLTGEIRA